jgi:hypothetical protein
MSDTQSDTNVMKFTTGQTITVMRGKTRGKVAEVIGVDAENKTYAVKYEDGTFGVINAVNVKVPTEATIGEAKLAAEIQTILNDSAGARGEDTRSALQAFVSRLSADLPGLGARISWPAS